MRKERVRAQDGSTLLMRMVNLCDPPNHSTAPRQFLSPALNFEASWENVFYLFLNNFLAEGELEWI